MTSASQESPRQQRAARLRVAVYGLRQSAPGWELLTFRQRGAPEAGLQVPAGGVERGEALEDAACRELREETGLVGPTVLGSVGWQTRRTPARRSHASRCTTRWPSPSHGRPGRTP